MFTAEELVMMEESGVDIREVIEAELSKLVMTGGRINLKVMEPRELDCAIHLLRQYLAMLRTVIDEIQVA